MVGKPRSCDAPMHYTLVGLMLGWFLIRQIKIHTSKKGRT